MPFQENISANILQEVTAQQAWHYQAVPFFCDAERMRFYVPEEKATEMLREELELLFGKEVELLAAPGEELRRLLGRYYRKGREGKLSGLQLGNGFLDGLIEEARNLGSSDIHMEPYEEVCRVRFRVDGVLLEKYQLPKSDYPGLANQVKIKAQLDIAEKRLPQDGRIFFSDGGEQFDIRVSTLPTLHGEKIVMRLLSSSDADVDIRSLGFRDKELEFYLEGVNRPNGMVLISGPTGSGKTTTLYATLRILNEPSRNILTIEDPIEYTLEGVNQVQLKESIGLNYASAIRTFLRQDPDAVMVGEIRDMETAAMAVRASLTGHMVLSTIHTNWAWGIVARLLDMGVPPYLLADTLNTAVAQRLVRLLCPDCKVEKPLDVSLYPRNYRPPRQLGSFWDAVGCEACHYSGYRGRTAVYEVIPIDGQLSDMIKSKNLKVEGLLREKGFRSLADGAFLLLEEGKTSLREAYPLFYGRAF
ncbi:MAG: type II/IV secretion system protein [Lewinellaceae bacterium]|nr:type II/IV secretion system protein [Lewinellaceae bacterium]